MKYLAILVFFSLNYLSQAGTLILGKAKEFSWEVSSEHLEHLPKWNQGSNPPLSIKDAESLAFTWTRKQPLAGYIPDRPFQIILERLPTPYNEQFFYKLDYGSADGKLSFWTVFVLMDGKIVEPKKIQP